MVYTRVVLVLVLLLDAATTVIVYSWKHSFIHMFWLRIIDDTIEYMFVTDCIMLPF